MVEIDEREQKKAILVTVYHEVSEKIHAQEHLEELALLAQTAGIDVVGSMCIMIRKFSASMFLSKGKLEELLGKIKESSCQIVIFDDEITPVQQRNLEGFLKVVVMDRTEVILNVFAERAKTHEARLQIEMARLQYISPRLKRMWLHLSRQTGGGGGMGGGGYLRGKGETQIEMDRRAIKRRKEVVAKELEDVCRNRATQKQKREKSKIPTFAIIGYTNAGKSTLLNRLTDAHVYVENKLFATLDTTTRSFTLPNNQEILLSDTVGFIRKLPHLLVAAFKSTLEEAVDTDVLIHLIDASHPQALDQAKTTFEVLKELHAKNRPVIPVLNKIDQVAEGSKQAEIVQRLRMTYPGSVQISAKTGEGMESLFEAMIQSLRTQRQRGIFKIPQAEYRLVATALREGDLFSKEYVDNDIIIDIDLPFLMAQQLKQYKVDAREEKQDD